MQQRTRLDSNGIMRRPMRLSELLRILDSGFFEEDMCTISKQPAHARAVDDPMCVVDDPIRIGPDHQETMPAYASAEGFVLFCHVFDAVDTIANTTEQQPNAGIDTVLMNLDHYLAHDTWMDLDQDTSGDPSPYL